MLAFIGCLFVASVIAFSCLECLQKPHEAANREVDQRTHMQTPQVTKSSGFIVTASVVFSNLTPVSGFKGECELDYLLRVCTFYYIIICTDVSREFYWSVTPPC
jgi:hypothetical protein